MFNPNLLGHSSRPPMQSPNSSAFFAKCEPQAFPFQNDKFHQGKFLKGLCLNIESHLFLELLGHCLPDNSAQANNIPFNSTSGSDDRQFFFA